MECDHLLREDPPSAASTAAGDIGSDTVTETSCNHGLDEGAAPSSHNAPGLTGPLLRVGDTGTSLLEFLGRTVVWAPRVSMQDPHLWKRAGLSGGRSWAVI